MNASARRVPLASKDSFDLAISLGDPQGIGPEITCRALQAIFEEQPGLSVVLFGDREVFLARGGGPLLERGGGLVFHDVPWSRDGASPPSANAGAAAFSAFTQAVDFVHEGRGRALVTAPLSKEAVARTQPGFRGHTDWLGRYFDRDPLMLLASDAMKVFLVTDHVPLGRVSGALTPRRLRFVLLRAREYLVSRSGSREVRLAVLGLNPHGGEGGELGREELDLIIPAIEQAGGEGRGFFGPFAADSFFRPERLRGFDGVIAMYHDQGLIPLKALSFGQAVNVTVGLPINRCSPDHGTAFDLAGRCVADFTSMLMAIRHALSCR
ncbi:MAG TPA: 4-hydroxythreonine-4-phosphate dehydrogenase PdxA [Planctomycetes bacterium]|nr:4-hydroxythreonine-4-phosphate dehydrogenase PdxA [Planctomycetota bacterium]